MHVICPYCEMELRPCHAVATGGVWLSDSREQLESVVKAKRTGGEAVKLLSESTSPLVCVIGGNGCLHGNWPKDAMYCESCGSLVIKCKPY